MIKKAVLPCLLITSLAWGFKNHTLEELIKQYQVGCAADDDYVVYTIETELMRRCCQDPLYMGQILLQVHTLHHDKKNLRQALVKRHSWMLDRAPKSLVVPCCIFNNKAAKETSNYQRKLKFIAEKNGVYTFKFLNGGWKRVGWFESKEQTEHITTLALNKSGTLLAASSAQGVRFWSVKADGTLLCPNPHHMHFFCTPSFAIQELTWHHDQYLIARTKDSAYLIQKSPQGTWYCSKTPLVPIRFQVKGFNPYTTTDMLAMILFKRLEENTRVYKAAYFSIGKKS